MNKILVIDDDNKFRALIATMLKDRGFCVVEAATLKEADVELCHCGDFSLIILDGRVGDEDGEVWLRNRVGAGLALPVLFVSAHWRETEGYFRLVNELSVRLVVHKPIQASVLADQVCGLLGRDVKPTVLSFEALEEIWQLAVEYMAELPARLVELSQSLQGCRENAPGAFHDAIRQAHKLRGTGSSFGQHWVTDVCTQIEERLKKIATSSTPTTSHTLQELNELAVNAHSHAVSLPPPSAQSREPAVLSITAQPPRILVVDDDPFFTRRVEHVLGGEGMIVTTFRDTTRLLEVIPEVAPDLIILDINFPGASGIDVCRQLRSHIQLRNMQILIVTSENNSEARNAAIAAKATDYKTKPIGNHELTEWVKSYISPRPQTSLAM